MTLHSQTISLHSGLDLAPARMRAAPAISEVYQTPNQEAQVTVNLWARLLCGKLHPAAPGTFPSHAFAMYFSWSIAVAGVNAPTGLRMKPVRLP
jgi:hypothetical protein